MDTCFKIVNSIRGSALQRRLFREQLGNDNKELLLHTNVRWLSRCRFLCRFLELIDDIKIFLDNKGDNYPELINKEWLLNLCFLADFSGKLNDLNLELQGKNIKLSDMISSIKAFKQLIIIWKSNLSQHQFRHFPNTEKFFINNEDIIDYNIQYFIKEIETVENEFTSRFQDLENIECIVSYFSNPYQPNLKIENISNKISILFAVNQAELEVEIIKIQNDMDLKSLQCIWEYSQDKYPIVTTAAHKTMSCFGSTYLAESSFSDMGIIKSDARNRLTNEHINQCLKISVSSYVPDFKKIAKSTQCQRSH